MICVEVHSNNVLTVRNDTFANAVSDSVKHEKVKFLFSDNWKDYQKTAVFTAEDVEPINIVLDGKNELCVSEDECYIPFEVLKGDSFTLSVFGVCGDSLATTTKENVRVFESGYALGDAPGDPTPDEYSQLLTIMTETREIAQSVRDDADSGVFNGEKGEKGDKGDKGDSGDGVGVRIAEGGEIFNDYTNNKATAKFSHASGTNTEAHQDSQFVVGYYNANKEDTIFEVGNGSAEKRSNAFEVYEDGHAEVQTIGNTDKSVVNKQYVDNRALEIENNQEGKIRDLLSELEHPVGSIWIGGKDINGNPTNPADLFGGTWELIDKEFASIAYTDNGANNAFTVSDIVSSYNILNIYGGHTIRMRLTFTPTVAFDKDSVVFQIGQFNLEKIGVNGLASSIISIPAMSDPANGLVMATIGYTGAVTVTDFIKSTTANQYIYINAEITCLGGNMLDEFCDKFYWQRVGL